MRRLTTSYFINSMDPYYKGSPAIFWPAYSSHMKQSFAAINPAIGSPCTARRVQVKANIENSFCDFVTSEYLTDMCETKVRIAPHLKDWMTIWHRIKVNANEEFQALQEEARLSDVLSFCILPAEPQGDMASVFCYQYWQEHECGWRRWIQRVNHVTAENTMPLLKTTNTLLKWNLTLTAIMVQ